MRNIMITESDRKKLRELIDDIQHHDPDGKAHVKNLDAELDRAQVLAPALIPSDVITMNSKVLLSIGEPGEDVAYTLVYPNDADISENRVSVLAPIGTAILGYRKGDTIEWDVPDGTVMIRVKKILYQPEAAGDTALT